MYLEGHGSYRIVATFITDSTLAGHIFDIQSANPEPLRLVVQKGRIAVNSCRLSRFWTPVRTRTYVYSKTVTFGMAVIVTGRVTERKEGYIGRQCRAAMESNRGA